MNTYHGTIYGQIQGVGSGNFRLLNTNSYNIIQKRLTLKQEHISWDNIWPNTGGPKDPQKLYAGARSRWPKASIPSSFLYFISSIATLLKLLFKNNYFVLFIANITLIDLNITGWFKTSNICSKQYKYFVIWMCPNDNNTK